MKSMMKIVWKGAVIALVITTSVCGQEDGPSITSAKQKRLNDSTMETASHQEQEGKLLGLYVTLFVEKGNKSISRKPERRRRNH
ncbi:hypothetical protein HPE56_08845 [Maribacter sp. ANRC-HE7]|uniref:Uncharacterized protein n=1 Tax=Maribacter aquimaris TaxID=2737171 RepID=A0ABR7UZ63_9FLAO|nr:hypothetical protein [Maribacter aquimaris]MBD0777900.1 hypothetical protein [Maribacter aquimaris]